MVDVHIAGRGLRDENLLNAFRKIPREQFVPSGTPLSAAYGDYPLPIGHGQTISQPFIVALMIDLMDLSAGDRVLEIGTGSGYETAILLEMGMEVISIEYVRVLALRAREVLRRVLPGRKAAIIAGNGYGGWPPGGPYDGIVSSAAPARVPPVLPGQLAEGGKLVIPVGRGIQELIRITRADGGFEREFIESVRFVPLVDGRGSWTNGSGKKV